MLERLKSLREQAGISQKRLAESIGVSQQSVNKYENHNIEPDIETLIHIADYFDTSVDYLIGHSDIDHRIEHLQPYDLNDTEMNLIKKYRSLSKRQRQSISDVIDNYLNV